MDPRLLFAELPKISVCTTAAVCGLFRRLLLGRTAELKIRARSPELATFPAVYAIIVGGVLIPLQELLQLLGKDYPCQLTLAQSCFFLPVWGAPFALRSLRVIIASSKGRTEKYGFFLRKRTTLAMEAFLCTVAACIITAVTQTVGRYDRGVGVASRGDHGDGVCYMLMEWEFFLPFCVIQAIIFGVLGELLRDVDDLLNISGELRVNFALYLVFLLPYFALQLYFRYCTHQNFPTSLQFLIAAMVVLAQINTMWASVGGLEDLLAFIGWKGVPGEGSTIEPSLPGWSEASTGDGKLQSPISKMHAPRSDLKSWKKHFNNISSIMRNKPMSAVLRTIANRFLCTESYEFLVRASYYSRSSTVAGEAELGPQHALFVDICKAHVLLNSEQEINISHEQRTSILQYMDSSKFCSLSEEERADILFEAQREVSRMLELNLLNTLHQSTAFAEACAALEAEARMLWYLEEEKYGGFFTPVLSNYETPTPPGTGRKHARELERGASDPPPGPRGTGEDSSGANGGARSRGRFTGVRLRRGLLGQWRLRAAAAAAAAKVASGRSRQSREWASSSDAT